MIQADNSHPEPEAAPPLWNPAAAANWSLLFTPAFGAALHMKNWQALGERALAKQAKVWLLVSLGYLATTLVLAIIFPDSKGLDGVTRSAGMGLLLGWYFTMGRAQQKYVKERFGKNYQRRRWGKPLGYAVLATIGFMLAAVVLVVPH